MKVYLYIKKDEVLTHPGALWDNKKYQWFILPHKVNFRHFEKYIKDKKVLKQLIKNEQKLLNEIEINNQNKLKHEEHNSELRKIELELKKKQDEQNKIKLSEVRKIKRNTEIKNNVTLDKKTGKAIMILNVTYKDREAVKKLGADYNPVTDQFYIFHNNSKIDKFSKWI